VIHAKYFEIEDLGSDDGSWVSLGDEEISINNLNVEYKVNKMHFYFSEG
jgi:hypothetical protein